MALSECGVLTDERDRELKKHGTAGFPIACYHDDLREMVVPWHWHEEFEAIVIERGSCRITTGTDEVILHMGEAFLINSGALHSCACAQRGGECLLRSIVFSPALISSAGNVIWEKYLSPIFTHSQARTLLLTPKEKWQSDAIAHILRAWKMCVDEPEAYEIAVRNELSSLIAIWRANLPSAVREGGAPEIRYEQRVKQMLTFIREHYAEEIDTSAIAASAAISESECLRCFKKMLNTTPNRYLATYRLEQAEALLLHTNLLIAEIGAKCGFNEMSYFARAFRMKYGSTPRTYRIRMKA